MPAARSSGDIDLVRAEAVAWKNLARPARIVRPSLRRIQGGTISLPRARSLRGSVPEDHVGSSFGTLVLERRPGARRPSLPGNGLYATSYVIDVIVN